MEDSHVVPRFSPFHGLRYAEGTDLAQVVTPPWDVISPDERAVLAATHEHNMVHVDLPPDGHEGDAARMLAEWRASGVLVRDDEPAYTVHRVTSVDGRSMTGVIGALELSGPEDGQVLPHERTTEKVSNRLALLRATDHNLSCVWGLSLASGLGVRLDPITDAPPDASMTDPDGVRHEAWIVTDPIDIRTIARCVEEAPVVIADGHHRYATSRQWFAEHGHPVDGRDRTMAFVVELAPDRLRVQAIHRLLSGVRAEDLAECFTLSPGHLDGVLDTMGKVGALAFVDRDEQVTLLTPRTGAFDPALPDLDSSRLDVALAIAGLQTQLTFQHGVDEVLDALRTGQHDAAVLLRPVTVPVIRRMAEQHELMPPKSTFFAPKLRTGFVLRDLTDA
jgi:uncharacterized protein (DUF1015 family)